MNVHLAPFLPRVNFARRLEPRGDGVLHGAGQDPGVGRRYDSHPFQTYWQAMDEERKPAVYMSYVPLKADMPAYFQGLHDALAVYDPATVTPQIGLYMNGNAEDGAGEPPYDAAVAMGKFDDQIAAFCVGLQRLARPTFVRIGFEFNGPWNGYAPDTYKAAWVRIVKALRAHHLTDVATVWCYCPLPSMREEPLNGRTDRDYLPYYPGDAWVDWWSIDLFSPEMFTLDNTYWFMEDATRQRSPVMIGECTPRWVGGVQLAEATWERWYVPFFNFIHTQPCVKAFCYINWDWDTYPDFQGWGDARIQVVPTILEQYRRELAHPMYVHARLRG